MPKSLARKQLLLVFMPLIVLGGFFASIWLPDFLESAFDSFVGPLLITYWIGLGFSYAWENVTFSMRKERFAPGMMAAVGLIGAFIFFSMLGGFRALWDDPWLFGVAVAPGLQMAWPWLEKRLRSSPAPPQESMPDT